MSGILSPLVSIVLVVQAIVFFMASHTTLMACKLAKADSQVLHQELGPIADSIPENCYDFPGTIFSLSDYLIETNPDGAKKLVEQALETYSPKQSGFNILYLSGVLLTYALNVAFYWYLIYVPYLIVKKAVSLAIWFTVNGLLALTVVYLLSYLWLNSFQDVEEKIGEMYENMDVDQRKLIALAQELAEATFGMIQREGSTVLNTLLERVQ